MILPAALLLIEGSQIGPSAACAYDVEAALAMDQKQFDQDKDIGWRKLADAGCDLEAADLVKRWRIAHQSSASILYWHEGQLRANAGQTSAAISLMERSRKTQKEDAGFGWNLYVDGTVAFLRQHRREIELARAKLAKLPRPDHLGLIGPNGKPINVAWPLNLNVLDGLISCWGKAYKTAYACSKPMFTYSRP